MEEKFFDLLGLGVPFTLAAGTYAVFSWLDNNASDEPTKVISSWLRGHSHDKPHLGNLIINAFDRIYTSPLLSFRAFRRSATISAVIWAILIVAPFSVALAKGWNDQFSNHLRFIAGIPCIFLFTTVMSDYISLLFVRRFLNLAITHPILASMISSIVGVVVVIASYLIIGGLFFTISHWIGVSIQNLNPLEAYEVFGSSTTSMYVFTAAFIIHLWLPLFALSLLIVQLVYWLFRAVEGAQWFLKQGDAHPLKAIGVVATIIVFGSAILVKEGWALLSVLERS
jgi:hypothetical protein